MARERYLWGEMVHVLNHHLYLKVNKLIKTYLNPYFPFHCFRRLYVKTPICLIQVLTESK